jgi:hypothetical protein
MEGRHAISSVAKPARVWISYLKLGVRSIGTMLDVGLFVLGTGLTGLAAAVVLDGFELIDVGFELSTAGTLGSGLVIGVTGVFAFGVASEGPGGRGEEVGAHSSTELAVGRLVGTLLVGVALMIAAGRLQALTIGLPAPFAIGVSMVEATGRGGLVAVPLLGVPLTWWLGRLTGKGRRLGSLQIPILYLIWVLAAVWALNS